MRPLLAAAFALCLAVAPAFSNSANAAPDAVATAADFHAALDAGNADAAAALLADDLTVYEEGHVERTKAEYLRAHLPADIAFSRAVPGTTTLSQTFTHGDMAWVISEGRTKGTYESKPVDRITTETLILRLDTAGWRIVHIHWSSHKAPAAAG